MKKIIILMCLTVFVVSCASNSKNNRANNIVVSKSAKTVLADKGSEEKVICRQTKRMGSNRISTVCLSQSESRALREATQLELRRSNFAGSSGPKGSTK